MEFKRIQLPYQLNELEPYMSAEQIDYHYNKHHLAYETAVNKMLKDVPLPVHIKDLRDLMTCYTDLPSELHVGLRNMGGGLINHNLFFDILGKDKELTDSDFITALNTTFGSFEQFKEEIISKAAGVFGSGWAWLVIDKNNNLSIITTINQDNPWYLGTTPILGIDVWEHAYYIDYRNDRKKYLEQIFHILDWEKIAKLYHSGKK